MNSQTAMLTGEAALLTCRLRAFGELPGRSDRVLNLLAWLATLEGPSMVSQQASGTGSKFWCNEPPIIPRSADREEVGVRSPLPQQLNSPQQPVQTEQVTVTASEKSPGLVHLFMLLKHFALGPNNMTGVGTWTEHSTFESFERLESH